MDQHTTHAIFRATWPCRTRAVRGQDDADQQMSIIAAAGIAAAGIAAAGIAAAGVYAG